MAARVRSRWFGPASAAPDDARRMYVIPPAGAGAASASALGHAMDGWCVRGVRLPRRESRMRDEFPATVAELADGLAVAVTDDAAGREVVLFGHCYGAILAYETACVMRSGPLRGLVVSAQFQPGRYRPPDPVDDLGSEELFDRVGRHGYLPASIHTSADLRAVVEPALRADYALANGYVYTPRTVDVPLLAIAGDDDPLIGPDDVAEWRGMTTSTFAVRAVAGRHDYFWTAPEAIAAALHDSTTLFDR